MIRLTAGCLLIFAAWWVAILVAGTSWSVPFAVGCVVVGLVEVRRTA